MLIAESAQRCARRSANTRPTLERAIEQVVARQQRVRLS